MVTVCSVPPLPSHAPCQAFFRLSIVRDLHVPKSSGRSLLMDLSAASSRQRTRQPQDADTLSSSAYIVHVERMPGACSTGRAHRLVEGNVEKPGSTRTQSEGTLSQLRAGR